MFKCKFFTILAGVTLLFFCSQFSFSEDFSKKCVYIPELKKQVFPVLSQGGETQFAIELNVAAYPEDATFSVLKKELQEASKREKEDTPEYSVLKLYENLQKKDREAMLALYADESSREYACEVWLSEKKFETAYTFFNEDVEDIRFTSKAQFGPYVHIQCKPILRDKDISMTRRHILKKTETGYALVHNRKEVGVFSRAASCFPYWKSEAERNSVGDLTAFLTSTIRYEKAIEEGGAQVSSLPSMTFYYKLKSFSKDTLIGAGKREKLKSRLNEFVSAYHANDLAMLFVQWSPSCRDLMKYKYFEKKQEVAKAPFDYLQNVDHFEPQFFLDGTLDCYVYATPISITGESMPLHSFTFRMKDGEYYFMEGRVENPFADFILHSKGVREMFQTDITGACAN